MLNPFARDRTHITQSFLLLQRSADDGEKLPQIKLYAIICDQTGTKIQTGPFLKTIIIDKYAGQNDKI
jgi:hypothetical protein